MIITYHNVEVKRCLAPFDTIAIVENNMHKEKEKREKHESVKELIIFLMK